MIPFVVECPELNLHMPFGTYSPKKLQHNSISPIAHKPPFANYGGNPGEKNLLVKVWFRSVLDTPFFPVIPVQTTHPPGVFRLFQAFSPCTCWSISSCLGWIQGYRKQQKPDRHLLESLGGGVFEILMVYQCLRSYCNIATGEETKTNMFWICWNPSGKVKQSEKQHEVGDRTCIETYLYDILGYAPFPVIVTNKKNTCLERDPHKPSCATVTGKGDKKGQGTWHNCQIWWMMNCMPWHKPQIPARTSAIYFACRWGNHNQKETRTITHNNQ